MKLLVVLALAAVALAKIPSRQWEEETFAQEGDSLQETAFKRGSEYQFRYNGQVATGLPGASKQHAATRIQAKVSLVLKGESKALLKIHQIRMGRLNQEMWNPRAMAPFMAFEEVPVEEEQKERLQLPVMFSYEQGVVSDLVFDGQEQPWSANIKKGIMNLLQVNLGKQNQIKVASEAALLNRMPQGQEEQDADFFATQEKTVEGECETLYTVTSQPNSPRQNGQVLNVTRSVDFENCKQRPEVKYNFRFQDPCESCDSKYQEDQKFLKSSSIAKFNISGNAQEFLIQSAMVESQYQVVPFNRDGNVISTYVNQTLQLIRAGPIVSKGIRQPKNPQQSDSDLVYTLDWDKDMEEFLMKGHNQARLPVELKECVKMVKEVLEPLVGEMRDCVSEQVPVLYARLVKLLRLAEKPQLEEIVQQLAHQRHQAFSQEQHQKVKALLTDALADAGTKDSVSLLLHLIKEQKISPLRAAITIKHLINLRTPSKEIVREFMGFLETGVVQENFVLKQAAYLTLGSMVQGLCMPSEERLAILPRPSNDKLPRRLGPNAHLCPQQLQDSILEKLFGMVEQGRESEEEIEEAMLALKTIGNMGIPKAVVELEKMIRSEENQWPQMLRIEAIIALRQLREVLPQKIQQILMPLYMNKYQSNEIRMASVYQILQTQPSRPVLDQVARKLFTERSQQVASFVFSYMTTLSNSSNPCERTFAQDLKLALRHGRKISGAFMPQYSKVLHGSAHSRTYRMGADAEFVSVVSNRTFVPRYMAMDLHVNGAGFWSKFIAGASIAQENVESLISRFARRTEFDDISLDDILSRSARGAQNPVKELKKIWEKLATAQRSMDGQAKAFASLKLKDQEFFMAPMTQKSLQGLPTLQHIRRVLSEGTHFNIHKAAQLHEITYKIPTTIGMPVIVKLAIPTVAQLSGQVRIESQNPMKLHLNNMKPAIAASILTSVTTWNPIVAAGLKVVASAKLCAPISGKAQLDIKGRMPSVRLSIEAPQKEIEWVRLETRPMTFTRVYQWPLTQYPKAQYKTIPGEQWNRVNNIRDMPALKKTEQAIEKVTGQEVRVESVWHRTPLNGPAYLPICPFSGPNHFALSTQPGQDTPKEYVMKVSYKNINKMQEDIRSEQFEMEGEEEFLSENFQSEGYQTEIKTEIYTKGAQQDRKAQMETEIKFSPNMRVVKAQSEITVQPIRQLMSQQIKGCAEGFVQYPGEAQSFQELQGKAVVAKGKATWGQGQCKEENKVEVKIGAKHSQQQEEQWSEEPEMSFFAEEECREDRARCSPVNLQGRLQQPQQLLNYQAEAKFQNVAPALKNATNAIFNALKTYYYWNTNQINFGHNNPEGKIRAQFTVDPRTKQFFNLTIKTPVENVTFTDAQLPVALMNPITIRRIASQISSPQDIFENVLAGALPQCQINSRRVQTFDEAEFRAPLSNCWTLLSKDCDDETNPAYAVLVKALGQDSQQKALKIVTRKHKIELQPESQDYDSISVRINGKQVQKDELPENQQIRFQKIGQSLKVVLPQAGVRVHFDGYSAQVQVSPLAGGAQCGLCGHYNNAADDEFRTPQNQRTSDARHFIQSYTLKDNKCQFPEALDDISSEEGLEYQPEWEQEERYQDSEEQEQEGSEEQRFGGQPRRSVRPVQRHEVQEEQGQICISAERLPRCPADSFPAQYEEEEREVAFKCISRRHPQAHRLLRAARGQRQLPQQLEEIFQQQQPKYTAQIPAPKLCNRDF